MPVGRRWRNDGEVRKRAPAKLVKIPKAEFAGSDRVSDKSKLVRHLAGTFWPQAYPCEWGIGVRGDRVNLRNVNE
jgi:hypothetical protein